jgi:hypothetical protein
MSGIVERIIAIIAEEASKGLLAKIDGMFAQRLGEYSDAIVEQIIKSKDELMSKFSEYKDAVDASLMAIAAQIDSESVEILAAIEAAKNGDNAAIEMALSELATKRGAIVDAIAGLVSTTPSPVEPTPVPEPAPGELPPAPLPTPEPSPAPPVVDPEVPVDVATSPDGTGVDGGFEVSPG